MSSGTRAEGSKLCGSAPDGMIDSTGASHSAFDVISAQMVVVASAVRACVGESAVSVVSTPEVSVSSLEVSVPQHAATARANAARTETFLKRVE